MATSRLALRAQERRARRAIVAAGRTLLAEGLVIGTTGNVSARVGREVLITPTRRDYDALGTRELVRLDDTGTVMSGALAPSREWPLHVAVYAARPDVGAVIHTHSVHATAWSFREDSLALPEIEELAYYSIGEVRTAPRAAAGTSELAERAAKTLGRGSAVLLAEHGVLTAGRDVAHALLVARVVEHQARIGWLLAGAAPTGPAAVLSEPPSLRRPLRVSGRSRRS